MIAAATVFASIVGAFVLVLIFAAVFSVFAGTSTDDEGGDQ